MARPKKPADEPIKAKWFKVWADWSDSIETLSDEQAGRLLKAMMDYSVNGNDPKFRDNVLKAYWGFIVIQLRLDRQKYINQVISNRKAGKISAGNKSKKTKKNLYQKTELSPSANADGSRDGQQVLTSVNEGKKERRGEPKEPKEPKEQLEVTVSLDKANDNFDIDGYNQANELWYKSNGYVTLSPKEKRYLRQCVSQHGAEFVCGCISALKHRKQNINTDSLLSIIKQFRGEE